MFIVIISKIDLDTILRWEVLLNIHLKIITPLAINKRNFWGKKVSFLQTQTINIMFLICAMIIWLLSTSAPLCSFLFQPPVILNLDQHMLIYSLIH